MRTSLCIRLWFAEVKFLWLSSHSIPNMHAHTYMYTRTSLWAHELTHIHTQTHICTNTHIYPSLTLSLSLSFSLSLMRTYVRTYTHTPKSPLLSPPSPLSNRSARIYTPNKYLPQVHDAFLTPFPDLSTAPSLPLLSLLSTPPSPPSTTRSAFALSSEQ